MFLEYFVDTNVLTLFLFLVVLTLLWLNLHRPQDIPPGPPIVMPFLGNVVNITTQNMIEKFREYRSKYGDIFSLKMGNKWLIVFNGYDTLREAFVKNGDNFSSRPKIFMFKDVAGLQGITAASGPLWKEHRAFALTKLREFGFGKNSLETDIVEEVKVLLKFMENQKGRPIDISSILHTCISNIICSIAFGKRFQHTDPQFKKMLDIIKLKLQASSAASLLNWLPIVKYIPGDPLKWRKVLNGIKEVDKFLIEQINEHWNTFQEDNLRDYTDAYIAEKKRKKNEENTFTDFQLNKIISEFFVAGTETTTTTILWAIIYLMRNPDVQDKMRQEIETVVGGSQFPSMNHRAKMPYTEAVITEVQRCGDIVPLSLFHGTDKDTMVRGFRIPKDAVLVPNLNSVLYDPKEFPEPYQFDPTRFIDSDGNFCGKEKVIAFSLGRRICPGDSMARMELFLFLAAMVQRFKFQPEKGKPMPSLESIMGVTRSPYRFKFCPVSVN